MYRCTVNVGVHRMLWFGALLCPAELIKHSAQLDKVFRSENLSNKTNLEIYNWKENIRMVGRVVQSV
jgi:hypothetical protein